MKMGIDFKIAMIIALNFFLLKSVCAQTYDELIKNTTSGKDITEQLPPLAELQQLAIDNSPIFKINAADVAIGKYNLKEEKRAWLNDLGIDGSAKYGIYDALVLTEDWDNSMESAISTTEQTTFYFGAYVKLPLADVIDRSNVKAAQVEIEKLEYQREVSMREIRKLVILRYNDVIRAYRKVIVNANILENYRIQMNRADVDFKNGIIEIADYVKASNEQAKAIGELEDAKVEYSTAFAILEETVGVKININN